MEVLLETTTPYVKDMTDGPLMKQLILFSLPLVAANLMQSIYAAADLAIVGNLVGAGGLSAVGIGTILYNLLLMISTGLSFGGQILLAQQVGAKAYHALGDTIGTMLTLTLLSGIGVSVLGAAATPGLLSLLNPPQEVLPQVRLYYLVCCGGLLFAYGNNCIYGVLRGLGNAKLPAVLIGGTAALNILLDLILIGWAQLGTLGAAIALVTAQAAGLLAGCLCLTLGRQGAFRQLLRENLRLSLDAVKPILKISLPLILFGFVMSASSMFVNSNVNEYGIAASAVDSISEKLKSLVSAVTTGIYTGGGEIVAQCFGAGKGERIQQAVRKTVLLGVIVWCGSAVVMVPFMGRIFLIFTSDQAVAAMAPRFAWIAMVQYLGLALGTGAFALFEGVGNTTLEMIGGITENLVVKILLGLLFSQFWGVYGYWLGCSLASFTMPVMGGAYARFGRWRERMHRFAQGAR
jgi:putative MATE family efflux protein